MLVSSHNTEHIASLEGDAGSWTTWGHDTPSETGIQDGWKVIQ